jgi:hypothetical protein
MSCSTSTCHCGTRTVSSCLNFSGGPPIFPSFSVTPVRAWSGRFGFAVCFLLFVVRCFFFDSCFSCIARYRITRERRIVVRPGRLSKRRWELLCVSKDERKYHYSSSVVSLLTMVTRVPGSDGAPVGSALAGSGSSVVRSSVQRSGWWVLVRRATKGMRT